MKTWIGPSVTNRVLSPILSPKVTESCTSPPFQHGFMGIVDIKVVMKNMTRIAEHIMNVNSVPFITPSSGNGNPIMLSIMFLSSVSNKMLHSKDRDYV